MFANCVAPAGLECVVPAGLECVAPAGLDSLPPFQGFIDAGVFCRAFGAGQRWNLFCRPLRGSMVVSRAKL